MELMRDAEVIDAETDGPITAASAANTQALQQPIHSTDDLAALNKLDEVIALYLYFFFKFAQTH